MESGYGAAGNGHKQNGEKSSQVFILESCKSRKVHGRMGKDQSKDRPCDHADKHEGGHIISWLHKEPHRKYSCQENIDKSNIDPHFLAKDHRKVHSAYKSQYRKDQSQDHFFPAGKLHLFLYQSEDCGKEDEEQGNTSGSAVYSGVFREGLHAVCYHVGVECICHHICKGCHNDESKEPAESQEQFTARLAYVFLNEKSHGFSIVFYTGVKGPEVCDSTEEDTAQDDPQKDWQPAEGSGLDGSRNRACSCDGRKLVGKYGPAVCRHIVLSVIMKDSRSLCFGVDAPFFRQPASI